MSITQQGIDAGSNQKEYIILKAAAARVKGDPVRIGSSSAGLIDVSIADDTDVYKVAVAAQDIASGAWGLYQVKGPCQVTTTSDTFTAGHGLHLLNGTVLNSDATAEKPNGAPANNDFGVVMEAGTAVTTILCVLYGDPVTAQT